MYLTRFPNKYRYFTAGLLNSHQGKELHKHKPEEYDEAVVKIFNEIDGNHGGDITCGAWGWLGAPALIPTTLTYKTQIYDFLATKSLSIHVMHFVHAYHVPY